MKIVSWFGKILLVIGFKCHIWRYYFISKQEENIYFLLFASGFGLRRCKGAIFKGNSFVTKSTLVVISKAWYVHTASLIQFLFIRSISTRLWSVHGYSWILLYKGLPSWLNSEWCGFGVDFLPFSQPCSRSNLLHSNLYIVTNFILWYFSQLHTSGCMMRSGVIFSSMYTLKMVQNSVWNDNTRNILYY